MRSSRLLLTGLCLAVLAQAAFGGVFLEHRVHTDSLTVGGKTHPARDTASLTWLEDDRMAVEQPGVSTVIVRLDQGRIYFVNHVKRTWSASTLPLQFPPEAARVFNNLRFQTTVSRTGETAKVGAYACEKILVRTTGYLDAEITHWCSTGVPVPVARYYEMTAKAAAFSPALSEMNEKLRALGNLFPVRTETRVNVMGARSRTVTELIKVDPKGAIPADRFAPPAQYREEPFDFSGRAPR